MAVSPLLGVEELREELAEIEGELARGGELACTAHPECREANIASRKRRQDLLRREAEERRARIRELEEEPDAQA